MRIRRSIRFCLLVYTYDAPTPWGVRVDNQRNQGEHPRLVLYDCSLTGSLSTNVPVSLSTMATDSGLMMAVAGIGLGLSFLSFLFTCKVATHTTPAS